MKNIKKYIFIILLLFLIISCYEQEIKIINKEMNGNISFNIDYSEEYNNLLLYVDNRERIDLNSTILFNKNKLKRIINKTQNVDILEHNISNNNKKCKVALSFNEYINLPDNLPNSLFPTTIYKKNNQIYISTIISDKYLSKNINEIYKKIESEEKEIIDNYLSLIYLRFKYITPSQIVSYNNGKISDDKKTLIYNTTLYDIINSKSDIEIALSFK